MIFAYEGVIPPKEWEHDPYIMTYSNNTVEDILKEKNIYVPD